MSSELRVEQVSVVYPEQAFAALDKVSLTIGAKDLTVALGPSGCGKTTLLNLLAGFVQPSSGQLSLNGQRITRPGADRAVVFQDDALLPWLNVLDNVAFGLRLQGVSKTEREKTANAMLSLVGLAEFAQQQIWQLSGGMRQRVGIARALASHSEVLLMDEPFGALDAFTREQMQELLLKVWSHTGRRIFLITHDIEEALILASHLVLMTPRPGRIQESLTLDFNQRWLKGEPIRSIKSDPSFIRLREQLLSSLTAQPALREAA
ncbi:taurine ABC transporter ATP-binding subunit [uncultured Thiothrix sp.]|uniref:taurine ABC transporter ATP-binding subunit n=1 Tax=uncultured Thiothrix sp. TaxID=223185 RepID=UPI0026034A38|nr:taurine ABC transporter ATP-binding subunit [uncultured Thiothrix sp.]